MKSQVIARGLAAEYTELATIIAAIRALRARGFTRLEAFAPYPEHALDAALGARRSPLSIAAGIGGLAGAVGGYFLQWWLVAYLYPVDVGVRPPHMPLPFTIITVEMGFLLGGLVVFCALFVAARLLKLWEPICDVRGFESATRDAFWLAIDARDPQWNGDALVALLRESGARQIHGFGGAA